MSVNKLALIRYKAIDECLRNHFRKWTLEDLMQKVSAVLYDLEGIASGVSKRTIQSDIQLMRSDKLGYNAPIIVKDRKYYRYEDRDYSITNSPINNSDIEKLKEIVEVLRQFSGFSHLDEMSVLVSRLENSLLQSTTGTPISYIQFESNPKLKGLGHLNGLYQAIRSQHALLIEYQSFKAAAPSHNIYYPYLLKEFRNRWFLIVRPKKGATLLTLALDRIIDFHELAREPFIPHDNIDFELHFSNVIGVTKSLQDRAQKITLLVRPQQAPYVLTKPIHTSQRLVEETEEGSIIQIDVVMNFELEREILSFGENIKVLAPRQLASRIKKRLAQAAEAYYANGRASIQSKNDDSILNS